MAKCKALMWSAVKRLTHLEQDSYGEENIYVYKETPLIDSRIA